MNSEPINQSINHIKKSGQGHRKYRYQIKVRKRNDKADNATTKNARQEQANMRTNKSTKQLIINKESINRTNTYQTKDKQSISQ